MAKRGGRGGRGGGRGEEEQPTPQGPSRKDVENVKDMVQAMREVVKESRKLEETFSSQARVLASMAEAMKKIGSPEAATNIEKINKGINEAISNLGNLKTASEAVSELGKKSTEAAESVEKVAKNASSINSDAINNMTAALKKSVKQTEKQEEALKKFEKTMLKLKIGVYGAAGALDGFLDGLKFLGSIGFSAIKIIGSIGKAFLSVGKSILSIPFKLFKSFLGMVSSSGGGIGEMLQALNDLRKEFGELTGPTNAAIIKTAKNMQSLHLEGTSAFAVFGTGAERVNLLKEMFAASGPNLRSFSDEIVKSNGAILALQRGLGLAAEDLEALALRTKASGGSINKTLVEITKQSKALGARFGLDAKLISREMGKAAKDMAHFGHISEKQIGVAVTYATKLGIKLDAITASFDKFSTFDDAAENVSRLNEAFGANIDVGEVMAEQDPAKQFEIVRRGLMRAGVQGEKLTYVQKKMLESFGGMSAETATAALSTKNASTSLQDIQKEADKAGKKSMSTADAMNKLAEAMERTLKAGEQGGGFFERFVKGLNRALSFNPHWMKLMRNIKGSLFGAEMAGMDFANMVFAKFPAINKILESLAEIFDPATFRKMFKAVTKTFDDFITTLRTDPKAAVENLMKDLRKNFFDFFNEKTGPGRGLVSAFKDIFTVFRNIIAAAIPFIMEALTNGIKALTEFIANPAEYIAKAKAKAKGDLEAGKGFMAPIFLAITESWPKLQEAFKKLLETLWQKLKPMLLELAEKMRGYITTFLLGKALTGAIGGAAGPIGKLIFEKYLEKIKGGADAAAKAKGVAGAAGSVSKQAEAAAAAADAGKTAGVAAGAAPTADQLKKLEDSQKAGEKIDVAKMSDFFKKFAIMMGVALVAFLLALLAIKVLGVTKEQTEAAAIMLVATAVTAFVVAEALKRLDEVKNLDLKSIIPFLAALAGVAAVGVATVAGLVALIKHYDVKLTDMPVLQALLIAVGEAVVGAGVVAAGLLKFASKTKIDDSAAKSALKVFAAMALVLGGMLLFAWGMLGLLKNYPELSPEKIAAGATLIKAVSEAFLVAATVVGVAAGIGALLALTGGIGLAALLAGLAMIGLVVEGMGISIIVILEALEGIPGDGAALKKKSIAFKNVMEAVIGLAEKISVILDSIEEFQSILPGAEDDRKMIDTLKDFVETILIGIAVLIISVMASLKELKPEQAPVLEAVGKVITSIGELMKSLLDSMTNFHKSTMGITDFLFGSDAQDMSNTVGQMRKFLVGSEEDGEEGLLTAIGDMIETMIEAVKDIPADSIAGSLLSAVAGAISATAQLIGNVTGPMQELSKQTESGWLATAAEDAEQRRTSVAQLGKILNGEDGKPGIISTVGGMIEGIIKSVAGIKLENPEAVKAILPVIAKMLEVAGNIVSSVMPALAGLKTTNAAGNSVPDLQAMRVVSSQVIDVIKALSGKDGVAAAADAMVQFTKGIKVSDISKEKLEVATKIMQLVASATGAVSAVMSSFKPAIDETRTKYSKDVKGNTLGPNDVKEVSDTVRKVTSAGPTFTEVITELKKNLPPLITSLRKAIAGIPQEALSKEFAQKIEIVSKMFQIATEIGKFFGDISSSAGGEKPAEPKAGAKSAMSGWSASMKEFTTLLNDMATGKDGASFAELSGAIGKLIPYTKSIKVEELENLKKMLTALKDTYGNIKSAFEEGVGKGTSGIIANNINAFVSSFTQAINALAGGEGGKGGVGQIADGLTNLVTKMPKSLSENMKTVESFATQIKSMATTMQSIVGEGVTPAVNAANELVASAKKLEESLNLGEKLDISTKLNTFVTKFGKVAGGKAAYKITTEAVVINVNFKIAMDSEKIEKIMVTKTDSIIREKINNLIEAVGDNAAEAKAAKGKLKKIQAE